jgi:coenzyme F420 hydrogenase subunit beta
LRKPALVAKSRRCLRRPALSPTNKNVVSALSLYCIEQEEFAGAVQTRARTDQPLLNETVISRSRADVLNASASRYAPASPCERLKDLRDTDQAHVFVGKPCDVAGAAKLQRCAQDLATSVALKISIFCAGTPSLAGTKELLDSLGVGANDEVLEVRYRGRGWPGEMSVKHRHAESGEIREATTSYAHGWGDILQKHKQWRCQLCADHLGDQADLSIGDPWYRQISADEAGESLIIVRTERGRRILQAAVHHGVVALQQRSIATLAASQPNLEKTTGSVCGRRISAKVFGLATPSYPHAGLGRVWWLVLSPTEKFKSLAGTAKRIIARHLYRSEDATLRGTRPQ